ncbi:hypothetical protein EZS27_016469 [termite gut metagenome]|uniref:Uncharacterized protein n=1 Tax=termite gut metagenome TaxID=433724 RepID=A0A5J4RNS8_9ZZZZ
MEEENRKTVAELTIYYKMQRLTSLIFDNQETADKFVAVIESMFNEKGKREYSFSGEIKTVYSGEVIVREIKDLADGKAKPEGTILEMIKVLDGLN